MAFALVYSRALVGVDAPLVQVEVHLANGLPQFNLVGLPDAEVRESRERVRAALANCGFRFPPSRITVNLAPADLPKQSSRFDLPIALGILSASGQLVDHQISQYEFAGELALTGEMRAVHGALPMAMAVGRDGRHFVLPAGNAAEAALARTTTVMPARHLLEVCRHLAGQAPLPKAQPNAIPDKAAYPDMADVKGQAKAKRVLEIAAAGRHHVLMVGPPGTGKSMLASRFPGICPPISEGDALMSAALHSASNEHFSIESWYRLPFRQPHHSSTATALIGGGVRPRPGEASLAHCGTLFLDEMAEFDRRVLEMLREPMETGMVTLSRAARRATFPARFQLLGAINPCPCGYYGDSSGRCRCTPDQVQRYANRISGPLMDRIDLKLEVPLVPAWELGQTASGENSLAIRARVIEAVERQLARQGKQNGDLSSAELDQWAALDEDAHRLLARAANQFSLSARGVHRVLRVARTVADLEGRDAVSCEGLAEALAYRCSGYVNP
jgi:magnesium chelatase family protein